MDVGLACSARPKFWTFADRSRRISITGKVSGISWPVGTWNSHWNFHCAIKSKKDGQDRSRKKSPQSHWLIIINNSSFQRSWPQVYAVLSSVSLRVFQMGLMAFIFQDLSSATTKCALALRILSSAGANLGFYKGLCPIHLKGAPEVE